MTQDTRRRYPGEVSVSERGRNQALVRRFYEEFWHAEQMPELLHLLLQQSGAAPDLGNGRARGRR
jgi:hypothetical protein